MHRGAQQGADLAARIGAHLFDVFTAASDHDRLLRIAFDYQRCVDVQQWTIIRASGS